ncbi:MAG: hypothetical protein K2Y27_13715 [Xanthobacteraceae bacterium]|nr:hypothetical protein [Xanthobacteraceae bacterium]
MLSSVTRKMSVWAAVVLIAVYAVSLLAPTAAVAFSYAEAHCLTKNNHGTGYSHVHEDGVIHTHDGGGSPSTDAPDGDGHAKAKGKYCGLFCLPALAASVNDDSAPVSRPHDVVSSSGDALVGGVSARLYRPPALAI